MLTAASLFFWDNQATTRKSNKKLGLYSVPIILALTVNLAKSQKGKLLDS